MHDHPPSLRRLQASFASLIRAPRGVRDAVENSHEDAWLARATITDERGSSEERLEVYANMYFYRLLESLQANFPRLACALGEVVFHNLVTDYVAGCPSDHPSVRQLGRRLPAFLQTHEVGLECLWLADLASLEWARLDVLDRADEPVLGMEELAIHAHDGFARLWLQAIEAHALVHVDHDIERVWRAPRDAASEPSSTVRRARRALLIWRQPDQFVYHRALEPFEAVCFDALRQGTHFEDLCEMAGRSSTPETAAVTMVGLLTSWTKSGLLRKLQAS